MRFDIITIFPKIFDSYFNESIIKRGREKKLVEIYVHNLRDFTEDKPRTRAPYQNKFGTGQASTVQGRRQKVDDSPYGGGPGMVLKLGPIVKAVDSILAKDQPSRPVIARSKATKQSHLLKSGSPRSEKSELAMTAQRRTKIILFSVAGKQFDQKMARDFAKKYDRVVMIAGHYEGIDERIRKVIKDATGVTMEEISIGPYTLTGGELPAMILVDAISRHIPGVLGKEESLEENRFGIGLPVYTRPEVLEYQGKKYRVPKVLLSGNHSQIEKWRKNHVR